MSTRSERIKALVEESNMSYQDLEKLTGIKNLLYRDMLPESQRRSHWMLLKNFLLRSMFLKNT